MKTLILASAAVLTLGFGSAFAATTGTVQDQQQRQVAMNAQANGAQTGSYYSQPSNAPTSTAHVGDWQPVPAQTNPLGGGY